MPKVPDPSIQAFREALEKSVTISREKLQEVIDDAVRRGRMTRGDGEEMLGRLLTRGREEAEGLLSQLEPLFSSVESRVKSTAKARAQPSRRAAGQGRPRAAQGQAARLPDQRLRPADRPADQQPPARA